MERKKNEYAKKMLFNIKKNVYIYGKVRRNDWMDQKWFVKFYNSS